MKLLHIDASALGAHSVSRGLTAAVVAEFVRNHPGIEVTYRDLHAAPSPPGRCRQARTTRMPPKRKR